MLLLPVSLALPPSSIIASNNILKVDPRRHPTLSSANGGDGALGWQQHFRVSIKILFGLRAAVPRVLSSDIVRG